MEASTSCQTLRTAQILHAIPISTTSFLLGFEAHSFWFPRMHAFRHCMAQRTARKHRLSLPEELICTIEKYVRAAATLHSTRYSQDFACRVANACAEATTGQEARDRLEASHDSFDLYGFIENEKQREEEKDRPHPTKNQDAPGLVQRYLAAIFNLAIIPSRRAGRLDPKHLYLCIPWWPVPRGELDLQRWHEEKAAAPEPSDLCTYFGWDAKPSPEVLTADDARAVGPSKEDVARLNHAICVLDLGVKGRKGKGESAARRRAVEGEVSVSYVDDSTTERKLWQPRRLLFSPVVASRDRARLPFPDGAGDDPALPSLPPVALLAVTPKVSRATITPPSELQAFPTRLPSVITHGGEGQAHNAPATGAGGNARREDFVDSRVGVIHLLSSDREMEAPPLSKAGLSTILLHLSFSKEPTAAALAKVTLPPPSFARKLPRAARRRIDTLPYQPVQCLARCIR